MDGYIQKYQSRILPVSVIEKNAKNWFEYLFNAEKPSESRYRCRLCYKYYDKFNLPKNTKTAVAKGEGTLQSTYEKNRVMIIEHAGTKTHYAVVQTLQKANEKTLDKDFEKLQQVEEKENNSYLAATIRMIRTV